MTGFGKAESTTRVGKFTVEISSVNNRFLEISARLPRQYSLLEYRLRELINARLTRGKVLVYVSFEESETALGKYLINNRAAKSYLRQLAQMKKEFQLDGEIAIRDLLMLPEIAQQEPGIIDENLIWSGIKKAAGKALTELILMRKREGSAMARDMKQRLKIIDKLVKKIIRNSSHTAEKNRQKLTTRIEELLHSKSIDPERLEQEVAFLAERSDISEECTRFLSHIDQYKRGVEQKKPVGKRLIFILQEMNREANTIGSKSTEATITSAAIALKEEVEKLREQSQNVE